MGSIDCDPATSTIANETVKAEIIYTADDDGLSREWCDNVWLNPPYARGLIGKFTDAVVAKYKSGEIEQATVLANNATETKWFQHLLSNCDSVCLLSSRVKFNDATGKPANSPLQGQAILYFGYNTHRFALQFKDMGTILYPVHYRNDIELPF